MVRTNKAEQQKHLQQWRESGLSQKAYCKLHQIASSTFAYWKRQDEQDGESFFIPIAGNSSSLSGGIHMQLSDGTVLHFEFPVNEALLFRMLKELKCFH